MKDTSLLQRDGVSYKTAESEEKRREGWKEKENRREARVVTQCCWCEAQWTTVIVLIVVHTGVKKPVALTLNANSYNLAQRQYLFAIW